MKKVVYNEKPKKRSNIPKNTLLGGVFKFGGYFGVGFFLANPGLKVL